MYRPVNTECYIDALLAIAAFKKKKGENNLSACESLIKECLCMTSDIKRRKALLHGKGVGFNPNTMIRRLFAVITDFSSPEFAATDTELRIFNRTLDPHHKGIVRAELRYCLRKFISALFRMVMGTCTPDREPLPPLSLKMHTIRTCALFIKNAIEVANFYDLDWLTPGALLENYSGGKFGQIPLNHTFASWLNENFYIEMNREFSLALPYCTWMPPSLRKFPDKKNGGRPRAGIQRIGLLEFLGAGLSSYYCEGHQGPWFDLYDSLDVIFLALSKQGHNILLPRGPNVNGSFHSHNIFAAFNDISLKAKEIYPSALLRPWYSKSPPKWHNKDWGSRFIEAESRKPKSPWEQGFYYT